MTDIFRFTVRDMMDFCCRSKVIRKSSIVGSCSSWSAATIVSIVQQRWLYSVCKSGKQTWYGAWYSVMSSSNHYFTVIIEVLLSDKFSCGSLASANSYSLGILTVRILKLVPNCRLFAAVVSRLHIYIHFFRPPKVGFLSKPSHHCSASAIA